LGLPASLEVDSPDDFKSNKNDLTDHRSYKRWLKCAKTRGTANALTVTLKSTFTTRTRRCQSAADAGAKSPTKKYNGENHAEI
jgi:hypothetical protein